MRFETTAHFQAWARDRQVRRVPARRGTRPGPPPRPAAALPSEDDEQRALFRWKEQVALAHEPRLRWLHHVPNGGKRAKATAGRLKAMGVCAGILDICLPVATRGFHGLYLELKAPGASPSALQHEFMAHVSAQGYDVSWHRSWVPAAQRLCWYLDRMDLARQLGDAP